MKKKSCRLGFNFLGTPVRYTLGKLFTHRVCNRQEARQL